MTPFSGASLYWVALDFKSSKSRDIERFNRFYDEVHVPEVFAHNPGFESIHRYMLQVPDPRGDVGAAYLAAYELDGEQAVADYLERETGPRNAAPDYSSDPPLWPNLLHTRWRVVYKHTAQTSQSSRVPGAIYIIGIDPPEDIGEEELGEFEEFYTNVHLPENTAAGGFRRGVRYERRHSLKHPRPGCPRYLAVYELADSSQQAIDAALSRLRTASFTEGPPSWVRHTTPWRLWYRSLSFQTRRDSLPRSASVNVSET